MTAYVIAVRDCQPIIYWRFEANEENIILNDAGEHWSGAIHNSINSPDGIRLANGHAIFSRTDAPRFLSTSDPIPDLNEQSFSLELWMRPDDLAHSTVLGIHPENEPDARAHLNVIEIATNTFAKHEPSAIRFLHRNSPEAHFKYGRNFFSSGICAHYSMATYRRC